MRTTKAHSKYALRFYKKQGVTARADSFARGLFDNGVDSLLKGCSQNECW